MDNDKKYYSWEKEALEASGCQDKEECSLNNEVEKDCSSSGSMFIDFLAGKKK